MTLLLSKVTKEGIFMHCNSIFFIYIRLCPAKQIMHLKDTIIYFNFQYVQCTAKKQGLSHFHLSSICCTFRYLMESVVNRLVRHYVEVFLISLLLKELLTKSRLFLSPTHILLILAGA